MSPIRKNGSRACRRWRRDLWREVDGSLSLPERERLHAHLEECSRCREALEAARRIDRILAAEPLQAPGRKFEERVLLGIAAGVESVRSAWAAPPRPAREGRAQEEAGDWWILGGGLAAAALVAVAAFSIVPRIALRAVQSAVQPAASGGAIDLLARGIRVLAMPGQAVAGLLQSPLAIPLALMVGVLALTLGWVRLVLSRSAG